MGFLFYVILHTNDSNERQWHKYQQEWKRPLFTAVSHYFIPSSSFASGQHTVPTRRQSPQRRPNGKHRF